MILLKSIFSQLSQLSFRELEGLSLAPVSHPDLMFSLPTPICHLKHVYIVYTFLSPNPVEIRWLVGLGLKLITSYIQDTKVYFEGLNYSVNVFILSPRKSPWKHTAKGYRILADYVQSYCFGLISTK